MQNLRHHHVIDTYGYFTERSAENIPFCRTVTRDAAHRTKGTVSFIRTCSGLTIVQSVFFLTKATTHGNTGIRATEGELSRGRGSVIVPCRTGAGQESCGITPSSRPRRTASPREITPNLLKILRR